MTWPDVLREACKVAGGERYYSQYLHDHLWGFPDGSEVVEKSNALPAYVAELLHAKAIQEKAGYLIIPPARALYWMRDPQGGCTEDGLYGWFMLPPEGRILAALVALGHMTIDQAREVE